MLVVALALVLAASVPPPKPPPEPPLPASDLIHSDLPIFDDDMPQKWPQHIGGDEIGCTSRVAFGTWRQDEKSIGGSDPLWYRVENYGVFHCWAIVGTSWNRTALTATGVRPSFFIQLEKTGQREIWALQLGATPGSDYLLLSRASESGIIKQFDVLQRECPKGAKRRGKDMDILLTSYCAINDRQSLIALARRMAKLPPLGTLSLVEAEKAE